MIVLFDGVCNLCSATVQFIIERDKKSVFRFAALQSDKAQELLGARGVEVQAEPESVVLIDGDRVYQRTSAALRIARHLGFPWLLFYGLIVVPAFLRDPFYRLIAKNRYRLWGKKESCMVPTPELRARFVLSDPEPSAQRRP